VLAGIGGPVRVPPGGRGADTEPGRQLGERLAFTQVGEDQEGLLARVQLAPERPDRGTVPADDPGREGEGLAGQRQRGTIEQHGKPLVLMMRVLVD
jgi:hypothetical protein